ncbi:Uncharacterized protein Fot_02111 [Forsythia ovata]|uniref:Xrn1 helical domain-containing protein n=1 Tax=Forsythia ovata TaxID=205694 RepID=A0ABD1X6F5_9LAMI
MSFIRAQRLLPDYNANTHHCLYGLDLLVQEEPLCRVSALEHTVHRAEVLSLEKPSVLDEAGQTDNKRSMQSSKRCKPYQFLHVLVLREYLELDMEITDPPENFVIEFERIVDDFIFICFFAGNDFLPHVPSLEIHEGSVGLLMHVYKKEFKKIGGYLVDVQQSNGKNACYIKLKRVEKFILYVGQYEDQIFTKRSRLRDKKLKQILSDSADDQIDEGEENGKGDSANSVSSDAFFDLNPVSSQIDQQSVDNSEILRNTKELKQKLKDQIRGLADTFKNGGLGADKVKLGVPGWKERYYKEKFSAESPGDIETTRKEVAISKLPFIDEERLLTETVKVQKDLKDFEIMRNTENPDKLFVRSSSKFGREIRSCCGSFSMEEGSAIKIDSILRPSTKQIYLKQSFGMNTGAAIPIPGKGLSIQNPPQNSRFAFSPECFANYKDMTTYRVHYQERPRKVNGQVESKHSVPGVIYKEAGTGFSFGRGKNSARDSERHGNFPGHAVGRPLVRNLSPFPSDARVPMVSSRGSYSNSRNVQPSVTNHSRHGDIGSLRISSAPMNNNFWPSNTTSSSNAGNYPRLHNYPTASPHGQVLRGWQQVSMENTSQNCWHNQYMSTNSTSRGGYQRMSTENTSQTWQHYQSTPTNFMARGGQQRMSTENTSQRRQHYQSMPTNSMARGGQQRMSTETTSQTWRHPMSTNSTAGNGSQTWRHPMSTNSTAGNGRGRGFP